MATTPSGYALASRNHTLTSDEVSLAGMEFNLADLLEAVVDTVPDRLALIAGDRRLTFAELDERANRVAHYLRDVGVVPGQHVGIYAYNRAEWAETMIGCYKARVVPINVNYRYVVDELRYLFDNADLVALVFEAEFGPRVASVLPALPKLRHLVQLDDGTGTETEGLEVVEYEHALAASDGSRTGLVPRSADDLYILYTGGTTGMPKGVMWRAEDIFFAAMGGGNYGGEPISKPEAIAPNVSPTAGVTFALAPLMHGNAQWSMFVGLFGGNTVVLYTNRRFDADDVWDVVEREQINVMSLVGDAMARHLVARERVAGVRAQRVEGHRATRARCDHRRHGLAETGVGHADNDCVEDVGVALQHRFDLFRIHLLTTGVDGLRTSPEHRDRAVGFDYCQVAGDRPTHAVHLHEGAR